MADDRDSVSANCSRLSGSAEFGIVEESELGREDDRVLPVSQGSISETAMASQAALASNNNNGPGEYINGEHSGVMRTNELVTGPVLSCTSSSNVTSQQLRPLILITDSNASAHISDGGDEESTGRDESDANNRPYSAPGPHSNSRREEESEEQVEEIDGIRYRIVAAVTKPLAPKVNDRRRTEVDLNMTNQGANASERRELVGKQLSASNVKGNGGRLLGAMRRKSSAFVSNLLSTSSHSGRQVNDNFQPRRRQSIYEMTKSPPPETSLEIYLSDRRRSSTVSAKQVLQQLEQQSTFETNYCQRQQYFKDLNQKLINQDKKLLNVVANRGQIHRHSVDIAQLPLHSAQANAAQSVPVNLSPAQEEPAVPDEPERSDSELARSRLESARARLNAEDEETFKAESHSNWVTRNNDSYTTTTSIDQSYSTGQSDGVGAGPLNSRLGAARLTANRLLPVEKSRGSFSSRSGHRRPSQIVIRKFQKLDQSMLSSTPAPDVKIGQRVAYKEYYGNEFGTIRWIGRVPQICPDWTVGVEFDNAIGEGDGSLNGRRYFIAKDCFAKFLPLNNVALVDQHVGRPEPGTMISVMSAAVQPGQMISIQRVSTVHVQHCFLNAPHQIPGADILAVNTRLHCQCPNCGPCAHVIKPPRTQRLAHPGKNATHMCQFSTYTCCGMESQEEALCTYTGNKIASLPPPISASTAGLPPIGNSWFEGAGYLSNLQAQQRKLMPEEYKYGAAPEDVGRDFTKRYKSSRRGSGRHKKRTTAEHGQKNPHRRHHHHHHRHRRYTDADETPTPSHSRPASAVPVSESIDIDSSSWTQKALDHCDKYFPSNVQSYNSSLPAAVESNLTVACQDKVMAEEEYNWYKSGTEITDDNYISKPKSAKVVYRNSIENRYLFPTDDLIDSTLEADLENLSQARYGRGVYSRLSSSRNIFKSLCSLVSCMSAQSNHSDVEKRYEGTMEFVLANNPKCANKSMPTVNLVNSNKKPSHLAHEHEFDNNGPDDDFCFPPYRKPLEGATHILEQDRPTIRNCDRSVGRHKSSSSDCGFSSASQNSINFQSNQTCSPVISARDEQRTMQIYKRILARLMSSNSMTNDEFDRLQKIMFACPNDSSSCCSHHRMVTQTLNANDIDQIIADIIKKSSHLATKYGQTQPAHSDDCKNAKEEISTKGCCLPSIEQNSSEAVNISNSKFHERSIENRPSVDDNGSIVGHDDEIVTNKKKDSSRSLLDGLSASETATLSSYDSFCGIGHVDRNQTSNYNLKDNRKISVNSLKSNPDSGSSLPKAFELKLTLSINSDDNSAAKNQSSSEQTSGISADSGVSQEDSLHNIHRGLNISCE